MKKLFIAGATLVVGLSLGFSVINGSTADAAQPGQVGNAPRCEVSTNKPRNESFDIKNDVARVQFKVTGADNCKVQLSANSFYAPTMSGQPWSKQELFKRETKVFGKGTHAMSVAVPTKSTPAKGCFYQIDLTYGERNVLPVHAYAHGKIKDCGQPKPAASCENLNVTKLSRTNFRFNAKADTKDGAKINAYVFTVTKNGKAIAAKTVKTNEKNAKFVYGQTNPGTYKVSVAVKTSEGEKTSAACKGQFTVSALPPEMIEVCEIATGKVVEIKKSQMSDKYTTDLTKCNVVPETPDTPTTPETPAQLPVTGPGAAIAIFSGVSTLAGAAHYFITRRFGL